jgi:hypothetical protein
MIVSFEYELRAPRNEGTTSTRDVVKSRAERVLAIIDLVPCNWRPMGIFHEKADIDSKHHRAATVPTRESVDVIIRQKNLSELK